MSFERGVLVIKGECEPVICKVSYPGGIVTSSLGHGRGDDAVLALTCQPDLFKFSKIRTLDGENEREKMPTLMILRRHESVHVITTHVIVDLADFCS